MDHEVAHMHNPHAKNRLASAQVCNLRLEQRARRRVNPVEYQQAFSEGEGRLCIHCLQAVPGCDQAPEVPLRAMSASV